MGTPAADQFEWNDVRIAYLEQLWAGGVTAERIAGYLGDGVTRSAVLGKLNRLGLAKSASAFWTDWKVALLKKDWADDVASSHIAASLGTTESAVTSKAARLGLPKRHASAGRLNTGQGAISGIISRAKKRERPDEVPALPDELPADAIPLEQRKSFLELGPRDCRYVYGDPLEDHFYCGDEALTGCSWCGFHFKVVFYLPTRRH